MSSIVFSILFTGNLEYLLKGILKKCSNHSELPLYEVIELIFCLTISETDSGKLSSSKRSIKLLDFEVLDIISSKRRILCLFKMASV